MPPSTIGEMVADKTPHCAAPDDTIRMAYITMTAKSVGCLPVVNDAGQLVGMLSERDVIRRSVIVYRPSEDTPVSNIMTKDPKWLPPEAEPSQAIEMMMEGGFRHLPVVDEGKVLGVVSVRDFDIRDHSVVKPPL